jgi:hypothetical protein
LLKEKGSEATLKYVASEYKTVISENGDGDRSSVIIDRLNAMMGDTYGHIYISSQSHVSFHMNYLSEIHLYSLFFLAYPALQYYY